VCLRASRTSQFEASGPTVYTVWYMSTMTICILMGWSASKDWARTNGPGHIFEPRMSVLVNDAVAIHPSPKETYLGNSGWPFCVMTDLVKKPCTHASLSCHLRSRTFHLSQLAGHRHGSRSHQTRAYTRRLIGARSYDKPPTQILKRSLVP
jgi:hypothetical protein